jgi:glycosyltransferase involved in cell wall biosynthesis
VNRPKSVVILQEYIPSYRVSFLGRRLVVRRSPASVRSADLLVIEQARRNFDAYRLLLPRRLRQPHLTAMWGHGRDYVKVPTRLELRLQRQLTNRSDWFFGYTRAGVDFVVEQGYDRTRTTVVKNSTDSVQLVADINSLSPQEEKAFRKLHGLYGRTALYIGALDESKLLPLLFAAGRLAYSTDASFRLVVGGDGPLRPLVEAEALTNEHVVYLGPLSGKLRSAAYKCSDVLTVPGRVGLVAVDSIASGLPIITTSWNLHAPEYDYLNDQVRVEVEPDPVTYADAVLRLLDDYDARIAMAGMLREKLPQFGVQTMASNFLDGILAALRA